jgi:hypothetical protein
MLPQLPDRAAAILPSAVRVGPSLEVLQYINTALFSPQVRLRIRTVHLRGDPRTLGPFRLHGILAGTHWSAFSPKLRRIPVRRPK